MKKTDEYGLDFQILQSGAICMYHKTAILEKDLEWLRDARYRIININTRNWTSKTVHKELKEQMDFPDYYGENLNAFNDCLGDLYPDSYRGLVIVLRHFDNISHTNKQLCEGLLDVIALKSRQWILTGKRLIGIVQSDDPDLYFDKVGGYHPMWNAQEWADETRKKK